jgi:hypothetical protein
MKVCANCGQIMEGSAGACSANKGGAHRWARAEFELEEQAAKEKRK